MLKRLSKLISGFTSRGGAPVDMQRRSVSIHDLFSKFSGPGLTGSDRSGAYARDEGYAKSWIVYKCVNIIAQSCASVPLRVYRKIREETGYHYEVDLNHELNEFITDPNADMGGYRFQSSLHSHMLLSGNAYILPRYGNPANNPVGKIIEYELVRPDRVNIETDSDERPISYDITSPGGRIARLPVQIGNRRRPVIHLKDFNPSDDLYGMSPVVSVSDQIDLTNAAALLNNALLSNGSRPSGLISILGGLGPEAMQEISNDFKKNFEGPENSGKTAFFPNDFKYQQMSISPKDGEYLEVDRDGARKIANAFGVPPYLLGMKDTQSTFANMSEARTFLYLTTIYDRISYLYGDKESSVEGEINRYLGRAMGDQDYCIKPDWESVEALAEIRDQRVESALRLGGIISLEEQARMAGADLEPIPGITDVPWRASGDTPITYSASLPENGEGTEEEDSSEDEKSIEFKLINSFTVNERQAELSLFKEFSVHFERVHAPKIENELRAQISAAAKGYQGKGTEDAAIAAMELLEDRLEKIVRKHVKDVMQFFGRRVIDAFEKSELRTFETKTTRELFNASVERFIREFVADEVVKVSKTTKDQIKQQILLGEQAEENRRQIAKRIAGITAITKARAKVIAQTETHAAANSAQAEAGIAATGGDYREWISAEDSRTRSSHSSADGKRVRDGQLFDVGGFKARYPGDPKLPGKERINCRCTTGFIVEEFAD